MKRQIFVHTARTNIRLQYFKDLLFALPLHYPLTKPTPTVACISFIPSSQTKFYTLSTATRNDFPDVTVRCGMNRNSMQLTVS